MPSSPPSSPPAGVKDPGPAPRQGPHGRDPLLVDALVPDAHLNAAVAGIRGLGWAGLRVLAVGPTWTAPGLWSRHSAGRAVSPSVVGDPAGYAERVRQLAAECGPLVVYPSREETIDLMLAERSSWDGVILPFPDGDVLDGLRDKYRLVTTARESGIETAETLFVGPARDLRSMRFTEPVVVKPARPVSALKTARLIDAPGSMERMLDSLPAEEPLLVQERLHGPLTSMELVLDREGRVVARFQHVTHRTWPSAAGSIALATSVEPDEWLAQQTASMLSRAGYWGLAQVDFVETPAGYVLLDVNPRFYRCLPLAVACGTNLPALWHAVTVGRPVGPPQGYRVGVTYRWLEADLVAAARGAPGRLLDRTPRPRTGAAWAAGDPLPGFLLGAWAVMDRVLRVLRMRRRTR